MLTRLRVKGFKNLVDVDVSFGPFTCIAGANGVGKSNLFDAIMFLSDLTRYSIVEAASRVRDPVGHSGDLQALFTRGPLGAVGEVSFEVEMLAPYNVVDDFGRSAHASTTFLSYELALRHRPAGTSEPERLEIARERLGYVKKGDARGHLPFEHAKRFRDSVVLGRRSAGEYVSTSEEAGQAVLELHGDQERRGPAAKAPAGSAHRTMVGGMNDASFPTVLAAKREMGSWQVLQLEPTALRNPDPFTADPHVSASGAHMAAALRRMGGRAADAVAYRLQDLLPEVRSVGVDVDETRRLLSIFVEGHDAVRHAARSLSDGTLRFLALTIMDADERSGGLLCLEEPENGIHPHRVPAMVGLLENMAVDPAEAVGDGNPMRQVIANSHSRIVVGEVDDDALLVATSLTRPRVDGGGAMAVFRPVPDTWRCGLDALAAPVSRGELLSYLGALDGEGSIQQIGGSPEHDDRRESRTRRRPRVADWLMGQLRLFEDDAA